MKTITDRPYKTLVMASIGLLLSSSYSTIRSQSIARKDLIFHSRCLHQPVRFSLLLPENYYRNNDKYPVIYLLHGFGGNNDSWLDRCSINILADSLRNQKCISEYIYVMPDADNSYYLNNFDSSFMFEDYFINEFIPFIDSSCRTLACKQGRTLMGLSMGGFGSIILAVKHPDLFGSVVALSAAVRDSAIFVNLPQDRYETLFARVFGPGLAGPARITDQWKDNSPYSLIDSTAAIRLKTLHWYIDCGMDDALQPANENFHHLLIQYGIPHEFHMRSGNHNWAYWYMSSVTGLEFLQQFYIKDCCTGPVKTVGN
jgi:enterochelin esterase-like enzyme